MFHSCSVISTGQYNGAFRLWPVTYLSLNILHKIQGNFPNCLIHFPWFHKTFFRNKSFLILIRSLIRTHRETDSLKTLVHKNNIKRYFFLSPFFLNVYYWKLSVIIIVIDKVREDVLWHLFRKESQLWGFLLLFLFFFSFSLFCCCLWS